MILRFAAMGGEYVAIDTEAEVYTTEPETVMEGHCLVLSKCDLYNLMRELDFNCYNYSADLSPVEAEYLPF